MVNWGIVVGAIELRGELNCGREKWIDSVAADGCSIVGIQYEHFYIVIPAPLLLNPYRILTNLFF